MGFLSNLFVGNKEDKALREALGLIHRIIDDEKYQLELLNPVMKEMIESALAFDKDPNGTGPFGFILETAVTLPRKVFFSTLTEGC
ncbi:MAG: hypothetical protein LBQ20_05530 [Rhodanobacter sp.]|jgi:hypothetical protein|nr:hypothetical protein [Rhodanobacter sp.]